MRPPCGVCGGPYVRLYLLPGKPKADPTSYVCRRCYREVTGEPPRGMADRPPEIPEASR